MQTTLTAPPSSSVSGPATSPARTPEPLPKLASPTVSIIICNYNYERFIDAAIASALGQTIPCEVIVVDDGSTDNSRQLLARTDPRVIVALQPNGGQLAAYNTGFARSSGQIVIFLDADDLLEPHAAQTVSTMFDEGIAKVHYRMAMIDETGQPLGGIIPTSLGRGRVLTKFLRHGLLYPSAPGSGNAYRRSVLERLFPLPLDPKDKVAADFFVIYGSIVFGDVAAHDQPLARYRLHRKSGAAEDQLVFGNASQSNDEAAKVATRYARLRNWLADRAHGSVQLPPHWLDFSVQKSTFATAALARPYLTRSFGTLNRLAPLLKSLWLQPEFGLKKKAGLSLWALLVVTAPTPIAFRIARYVCNPASRRPTLPA